MISSSEYAHKSEAKVPCSLIFFSLKYEPPEISLKIIKSVLSIIFLFKGDKSNKSVYGFIGLIFANKPSACLSFKSPCMGFKFVSSTEPNNTASVFRQRFVVVK